MIFSSTPETNDDPEPLYLVNIDMRVPGTEDDVIESCERWSPRPEFDRVHQPNPILVELRRNGGKAVLWTSLDRVPSEEEKKHAQKVLSRLAKLKEVSK